LEISLLQRSQRVEQFVRAPGEGKSRRAKNSIAPGFIGPVHTEALHATAEDGHQEAAVCEAILRSHREKAWVADSEGAKEKNEG
jgi:hypothetical protein